MNVHILEGCAPTPLAGYLKALGVLRLVSEQADPTARGCWREDRFVLVTILDEDELLAFFLETYAPTPMLSPWNGGSGFYPKDNRDGPNAILASQEPRFLSFREAIENVHHDLDGRAERPDKKEKPSFLRRCRNAWTDDQLTWMNAALAVLGDDIAFPSLLGTGGNDGRLDFTNNYMQRLSDLFLTDPAPTRVRGLLEASLFDRPHRGLEQKAIGQFLPGGAGGMNAGPGYEGSSTVNAWDFVLMLEGALTLQVAAVRQLDSHQLPVAAAPFAFRARAAGFGSAARSEESARGEQWFPLWERPVSHTELRAVFREGRMQAGGRRATEPVDAAMALGAHGTSRGITSFQRYAYIERNGLSNLAVPVGRWQVASSSSVGLVEEIEPWVAQLRRASRDASRDPASLRRQVRSLEAKMLAVLREDQPSLRARRIQDLVIALGEAEQGLLRRPKHTANQHLRPLPPLSDAWLTSIDDGTPEVRLAIAFATQHASRASQVSLRSHLLPLDGHRFEEGASGLQITPDLCWTGRNLTHDLVALLLRRLTLSEAGRGLDLWPRLPAPLAHIQAYLLDQTDDDRLAGLARGLSSVRVGERFQLEPIAGDHVLLPAYGLVRSALPGRPIRDTVLQPSRDGRAAHHLASGRAELASELLVRRLTALGVRPRLTRFTGDRWLCRRLLASLAFPISNRAARNVLRDVSRTSPTASQGVSL